MSGTSPVTIQQGSKSFALASLLLPKAVQEDCARLYLWCRYCDDQIDHAENSVTAEKVLARLFEDTTRALKQDSQCSSPFAELADVVRRHRIPERFPLELLEGFRMDVQKRTYDNIEDLEDYAYHVAGVVGLMMSYIMGVDVEAAGTHAVALGNAMQLTNIARDVKEDDGLGRVYLPQSWLRAEGLTAANMWQHPERLFRVVEKLLRRADELYDLGRQGFPAIPAKSRWSIAAAARIYQHIGTKIRLRGASCLNERTYVNFIEKLTLAFKGVFG